MCYVNVTVVENEFFICIDIFQCLDPYKFRANRAVFFAATFSAPHAL